MRPPTKTSTRTSFGSVFKYDWRTLQSAGDHVVVCPERLRPRYAKLRNYVYVTDDLVDAQSVRASVTNHVKKIFGQGGRATVVDLDDGRVLAAVAVSMYERKTDELL